MNIRSILILLLGAFVANVLYATNDTWFGLSQAVTTTIRMKRSGYADPPRLNTLALPVLPKDMIASEANISVSVRFVVSEDGHVQAARISESTDKPFAALALETVNGWTFQPARDRLTHKSIPVEMECKFILIIQEQPTPPFFD